MQACTVAHHDLFVQHFSKEDEDDVDSEDAGMEWNLAGSEMAQFRWRAPASSLLTTVQPPHPHLVKI